MGERPSDQTSVQRRERTSSRTVWLRLFLILSHFIFITALWLVLQLCPLQLSTSPKTIQLIRGKGVIQMQTLLPQGPEGGRLYSTPSSLEAPNSCPWQGSVINHYSWTVELHNYWVSRSTLPLSRGPGLSLLAIQLLLLAADLTLLHVSFCWDI